MSKSVNEHFTRARRTRDRRGTAPLLLNYLQKIEANGELHALVALPRG